MKKQNKKYAILGIVLLAIILILQFQTGFLNNFLPLAVGGTNTLSLSQAQLQSSNSFLSGKVWLLTFSSGGLGQRYYGSFSPSDVQSATSDSSTTTNSFSVDVEYSDQTCNYPIINTNSNKPIYDIQSITWEYVPFVNPCTIEEAKTRGLSNILYALKPSFSVTCYAVGYNSQSPVGNINNPDLESEFTIKINAGGKSASKTINTLSGSTQGQIGDFAYASWGGNLNSGQSCDSQNDYKTAYVNGFWRVISKSSYNNYVSQVSSTPPSSKSSLDVWISNLKNSVSQAKQSKSFGTIGSQSSLSNAVIKIVQPNQIQFPVTTLYIKADTIGIYTPTPEIKLSNTNSGCFKTGEQGSISVDLENVGGERGTWNLFAECQNPFSSSNNLQVSLNEGEKITKLIPISASSNQKTTGSCVVKAENPSGTKSINVNTCVDPQITCTPNELFCSLSGNVEVIKKCSSDGATSSIVQQCSVGQFCEKAECKIGDRTKPGNFLTRFFNSIVNAVKDIFNFTGDIFSILRLILLSLVGIVTTLLGKDIFSGFKALRKQEWIAWGLAILGGGLFAYLTYLVFWYGLIGVGIFTLIKFTPLGKVLKIKR